MDTVSPGLLDEALSRPLVQRVPRFLTSPAFWAGFTLVALFATVLVWRLGICVLRVKACGALG